MENLHQAGITKTGRWEWIAIIFILVIAAWLRLAHFDLLEFQRDEAAAVKLALDFLQGKIPGAGLVSSVGVSNPPLFIYLITPIFALSANPAIVSGGIALLGIVAVAVCWHVGRTYYGAVAGLVAAAMFAASPWAVLYSRKIWAQDFLPIFATLTIWAVHALCLGKRKRAIFWVMFLPLATAQIHFSGLALAATVGAIVLWLRPPLDWRYGAAGALAAAVLLLPYLKFQQDTGWAEVRQFFNTGRGGQRWEQVRQVLPDATVDPLNGLRLPSRNVVPYAFAVANSGRIEDALGISTDARHDPNQVYANKDGGKKYFTQSQTLGYGWQLIQQFWFAVALGWLAVVAGRAVWHKRTRTASATEGLPSIARVASEGGAWILTLWFAVPLLMFALGRVWVFLPYFFILYPVHFLASGALAETAISQRWRRPTAWATAAAVTLMLVGNVVYLWDFYRFIRVNGGAQGSYGTGLGWKLAAAKYLAERGGLPLRKESETQVALAMSRNPDEHLRLAAQLSQPTLLQLNYKNKAELPELEWPFLIAQAVPGAGQLPTSTVVLIVDGNREALTPGQRQQLEKFPRQTFGPIRLYFTQW